MKKFALCLAPFALFQGLNAEAADKPKQIVIVSFDGAADNALWDKSMEMAKRNNAHFTYFLSCTFFMNPDERAAYQAPHQRKGRSNVGFAQTQAEVKARLSHVWQAHLDGHDIGSHVCGHFDGAEWSKSDWVKELTTFRNTMKNAYEANRLDTEKPDGWDEFTAKQMIGFRAPYLSVSSGLVPALAETGFRYDASLVSRGPVMPEEDHTITRFSLPLIPEGPRERRIIAMDYNMFVRHSGGIENTVKSKEFEERAYQAFRAAFDRQYSGDRIPLQLGFHFVEMNGGAYWRALDRITSEVCSKPDVACISYAEALPFLNKDRRDKPSAS
ncbi:polysaccharide deacetylase [Rhizobium sp. L1K21]|uniref:polysaccharide deacetylase n=1 Tax=Rhizobium sp. L1K21 TaxID=2954933 RepID=UPI0020934B6E|nr:polysaccharide deacetylase [Rhizobium sp. L1K21]MCO6185137.1 polysaccharide deacetylase [Rhizobium sp. L1K21]